MQKLLTPAEIAELLSVKVSSTYQWTHGGFVPLVKLSKNLRFRLSEIEK